VSRDRRPGGRFSPPRRVLILGQALSEDDPPDVREGIVRRRLVATTGRCPCGATMPPIDLEPGKVNIVRIEHEPGCPAIDTEATS
jgi:hypothetical protein